MGDSTDPVRALKALMNTIDTVYAAAVQRCVTVPLHDYEYEAFVSLTYNIGTSAFCKSTLVKKVNTKDYGGACKEILRWDKAGGQVVRGLTIRRDKEYQTCIGSS